MYKHTIIILYSLLTAVVRRIFYSTKNHVVNEGDGVAEVCLMFNVPLSVDLDVDVTSGPASGLW